MGRLRQLGIAAVVVALSASACGGGSGNGAPRQAGPSGGSTSSTATGPAGPTSSQATDTESPASAHVEVVRTITTGIDVPWGLALLPDKQGVLVSSRDDQHVYRVDLRTGRQRSVGVVPGAVSNHAQGGEAGLLGLALSPSYSSDHRVYAYWSTTSDNQIGWFRLRHGQLGRPHVIVRGIPHGVVHDGGRLAFGPDGMLYAGTGESGRRELSQDRQSLGGKILRMTPAGAPAPGNPFGTLVYSYGHRNVQGLAFDSRGRLWASEFGENTADELNLVEPGRNYGWPATEGKTDDPRYTAPVAQWGTDEDSPSGIAYAAGSIWMAALAGQRLWRIPLHGATAGTPREFLTGRYGRLRTVLALDDRTLLVTTSNRDGRGTPRSGDDRMLELEVR
jgi:glucose/arabinose dehydrogenase